MLMEVTGMTSIMTSVGDIFTTAISWVGDVATTISATGNEILLLFALLPLVGLGVGLFKRLISIN